MARRRITEDEAALWKSVAKTALPLRRRRKSEPATPDESPVPTPKAPPRAAKAKPAAPSKASPSPPPTSQPPASQKWPAELAHGASVGIDKRQAERFRRGKTPIEGRIDLHGRTQREAHDDLNDFLSRAHAAGKRCVLVITGKGVTGSKIGVLRANVPRWLNEPNLRRNILAFDYAEPQHGGEGALYVLLKRKKEPAK
ncbi:MAG TPA: Smr/MutS family protein [Dongiaceae bacterium]